MRRWRNPHIVAIIQARMGATRLPGKTLADIDGKPLLAQVIHRVRAARRVEQIVIATTADPRDRAILELALQHGLPAYAGSVHDVLDRFYYAARQAHADIVVRITADDPFKDPQIIDRVVEYLLAHPEFDYVCNTLEPTFPEGLDVEAFSGPALARAWQEAELASEREHVTPYIWNHPDKFLTANLRHEPDLSHLRWTIDYEADLAFAREVYRRLGHRGLFLMEDILALLEAEPELARINQGVPRNEGYLKSLARDGLPRARSRAGTGKG